MDFLQLPFNLRISTFFLCTAGLLIELNNVTTYKKIALVVTLRTEGAAQALHRSRDRSQPSFSVQDGEACSAVHT